MSEQEQSIRNVWQNLYSQARFYQVDLVCSLGQNEIGLEQGGLTYAYPSTASGMTEAFVDIQRAFETKERTTNGNETLVL